jgi:hypothetical protein
MTYPLPANEEQRLAARDLGEERFSVSIKP